MFIVSLSTSRLVMVSLIQSKQLYSINIDIFVHVVSAIRRFCFPRLFIPIVDCLFLGMGTKKFRGLELQRCEFLTTQ